MAVGSDKLRLLRRIPDIRFEEELRGYSKNQVDRVLENLAPLADEIEELQRRLEMAESGGGAAPGDTRAASAPAAEATTVEFDETLRNTLLLAQRTADQTVKDAESEAEQLRTESAAKADSVMASARAEAKELKGEAHSQREQMLAEAEAEQARLLTEARDHAVERRQAVETELTELEGATRAELVAEIEKLRADRSELDADVKRFEEFLTKRRDSIRTALGEIDNVIDDPERLAEMDAPEPVEVDVVSEEDLPPIAIESTTLMELDVEAEAAAARVGAKSDEELAEDELEDELAIESEVASEFDAAIASEGTATEGGADLIDSILDDAPPEDFDERRSVEERRGTEERRILEDRRAEVADSDAGDLVEATGAERSGAEAVESVDDLLDSMTADTDLGLEPDAAGAPPFADEVLPPDAPADDGITPFAAPESVYAQSSAEPAPPASFTDPSGLGIDVEAADFAAVEAFGAPEPDPSEEPPPPPSGGVGSLAEQARSRLASRVSKLRESGSGHSAEGDVDGGAEETMPPPPSASIETEESDAAAPIFGGADSPGGDTSYTGADTFGTPAPFAGSVAEEPPPITGAPSFPTEQDAVPHVGDPGQWSEDAGSVSPPPPSSRPAPAMGDLPPEDPFLDELRRTTGPDTSDEGDETLNRFLSTEHPDEGSGGWFGRRKS